MEAGAEYRPVEEIEPIRGLMDQVTAVLALPVTVAANCRVWEAVSETLPGVTETATVGERDTAAVADFVESAMLVAVMVTV